MAQLRLEKKESIKSILNIELLEIILSATKGYKEITVTDVKSIYYPETEYIGIRGENDFYVYRLSDAVLCGTYNLTESGEWIEISNDQEFNLFDNYYLD